MRMFKKIAWSICLIYIGLTHVHAANSDALNPKINECNQMLKSFMSQKALDLSEELIKQDKFNRAAQLCKGKSELALGLNAQAISTFHFVEQLSKTSTEKMMAKAFIGNAYLANKQAAEALTNYKVALELAKSEKNLGFERVSHNLIASALFLATNYDEAISEYQIALKLAQNDAERADIYERFAECYEKKSNLDSAIDYQIKAALAHTKYSDQDKQANAQLELGRLYFESRLLDQSMVAIEKVVAMAKDNSPYWESKSYLYLAKTKIAMNKSADAITLLTNAKRINDELKDNEISELIKSISDQITK